MALNINVNIRLDSQLMIFLEKIMTIADDITEAVSALQTEVAANTDATSSVHTVVQGLKDQITTLEAAVNEQTGNAAKLQTALEGLRALKESINADTMAENAIANT